VFRFVSGVRDGYELKVPREMVPVRTGAVAF
jgi:hypothetical protein